MLSLSLHGQPAVKIDTAYYARYKDKVIITPFFIKNHSVFAIANTNQNNKIKFFNNKPIGLGLRIGYDWLALSASYETEFIDPSYSSKKGKSSAFSMQSTLASRKFLVDFYFQNNNGMYLFSEGTPSYTNTKYYVRPDIHSRLWGFTSVYVFNGNKFSVRPLVKFDTWQKKSAGSFFTGMELLSGETKADSTFIPKEYQNIYPQSLFNKVQFLLFGPSIGYGHSFVYKKHFFITAIAFANADAGHISEFHLNSSTKNSNWGIHPNINLRGGIGYNTINSEIIFSYFGKKLFFAGDNRYARYLSSGDQFRISYTRRIHPGKKIPRVIHFLENVIDQSGFGFLIK